MRVVRIWACENNINLIKNKKNVYKIIYLKGKRLWIYGLLAIPVSVNQL